MRQHTRKIMPVDVAEESSGTLEESKEFQGDFS